MGMMVGMDGWGDVGGYDGGWGGGGGVMMGVGCDDGWGDDE